MIRHTVAAVVVALLGCEESGGWPEAMDALMKGMSSQDLGVVEVSSVVMVTIRYSALRKLIARLSSMRSAKFAKIFHISSTL